MPVINPREQSVIDWLAERQDEMIVLLEELVNVDSGSRNKVGVDRVGERIGDFLKKYKIDYDIIPHPTFGDAVRSKLGSGNKNTILLMGHRDTVFPDGEASRRPFRRDNGRGYGPGVADMKAGLVMNCYVLAALKISGSVERPVVGLFTADEEIGSPSSRALIEAEARKAGSVFNAEPSRPNGAIVTGRKAGIFIRFEVHGKAAHSGANFEKGISAIDEIAHKIIKLHDLTDLAGGVTVNVGIVSGGQTVNTIAPLAKGEVDVRYVEPEDRQAMLAKVQAIMAEQNVPGTHATFEISGEFLPLTQTPESKRLAELYRSCGEDVGIQVTEEFTGGCADSGFASAVGAPTICGIGPIGGQSHSPDEYVELDSLLSRAQTLALSILRLP